METQIIEKSNPIYILARSDENNNITYFHGAVSVSYTHLRAH